MESSAEFDSSLMETSFESVHLSRYQYFKEIVDQLASIGMLEASRQPPISQLTLDFLINRNKDPLSMLNIYCVASGTEPFNFYLFELNNQGSSKFLYITELDGKPVHGICASSKKEAKKACALRILDNLMAAQRLDCISEHGRKVKRLPPKPLPIQLKNSNEDGEHHSEEKPTFTEDVDLDAMKTAFEEINPLPEDCKEPEAFEEMRSIAFKLHCENAFWHEKLISEQTKAELEKCKMADNPVAFVDRCLTLVNAHLLMDPVPDQECLPKQTVDYWFFTLPYTPPRYVCLARLDGQHYHGTLAVSKQKAKHSCANVLSEAFLQKGWADAKKAKKRQSTGEGAKTAKKKKKRGSILQVDSYQYVLNLQPNEELDPRTHFYLSTLSKNSVQALKEFADQEQIPLTYTERKDEATGNFIARVDSIDGTACGCHPESPTLAKCSAARKAIDVLIKTGRLSINQEQFDRFRSAIKKFAESL